MQLHVAAWLRFPGMLCCPTLTTHSRSAGVGQCIVLGAATQTRITTPIKLANTCSNLQAASYNMQNAIYNRPYGNCNKRYNLQRNGRRHQWCSMEGNGVSPNTTRTRGNGGTVAFPQITMLSINLKS